MIRSNTPWVCARLGSVGVAAGPPGLARGKPGAGWLLPAQGERAFAHGHCAGGVGHEEVRGPLRRARSSGPSTARPSAGSPAARRAGWSSLSLDFTGRRRSPGCAGPPIAEGWRPDAWAVSTTNLMAVVVSFTSSAYCSRPDVPLTSSGDLRPSGWSFSEKSRGSSAGACVLRFTDRYRDAFRHGHQPGSPGCPDPFGRRQQRGNGHGDPAMMLLCLISSAYCLASDFSASSTSPYFRCHLA